MVHDVADVPAGPGRLDAVRVKFNEQPRLAPRTVLWRAEATGTRLHRDNRNKAKTTSYI